MKLKNNFYRKGAKAQRQRKELPSNFFFAKLCVLAPLRWMFGVGKGAMKVSIYRKGAKAQRLRKENRKEFLCVTLLLFFAPLRWKFISGYGDAGC